MAHLICELEARLSTGNATHDNSFDLQLTQQELADATGHSVVHVNRTMRVLRQKGLVTQQAHRLTIPDPDALATMCEFKPDYLHLEGLSQYFIPGSRYA